MNLFLVDGEQMSLSQELAKVVGVKGALLLQQLHEKIEEQGVLTNGEIWYCQSYEDWSKQLLFWNVPQIMRIIQKLEKLGVVISTNKLNKFCTDRTKWYRIDYERVKQLLEEQIGEVNMKHIFINPNTSSKLA